MNKKFVNLFLPDGNLTEKNNALSGTYRGYYIFMKPHSERGYYVIINAFKKDESSLNSYLKNRENFNKSLRFANFEENKIYLIFKPGFTIKGIIKKMNFVIDEVTNYLKAEGFVSACESCGSTDSMLSAYMIDNQFHFLCSNCSQKAELDLEVNNLQTPNKSNLITGIVGAFLGALIGGALWIIIFELGYIAGIAGAITAICALKGYQMLGGRLDMKGIIVSLIIGILMIYFAHRLAWGYEIYKEYKGEYDITYFDAYHALPDFLKDPEISSSFYKDLIIGYILTIVCSFSTVFNSIKQTRGSNKVEKL